MTDGVKVYRLTFSRSLAEYIAGETGHRVERKKFVLGRQLEPG